MNFLNYVKLLKGKKNQITTIFEIYGIIFQFIKSELFSKIRMFLKSRKFLKRTFDQDISEEERNILK